MATELAIPFSSTEFEALRLGFLDNNKLHMNACCILPDYETLNEESVMLDFSGALMKTSIKSLEVFDTIACGDSRRNWIQKVSSSRLKIRINYLCSIL